MSLIGKSKQKYVNNSLGAGVHLAIVSRMEYAKDNYGNLMAKKDTGELALDLEFKNEKGTVSNVFWMTEKAQWVFDALCRAVEVDNKKEIPSVNDIINKRLWILVGSLYSFKNGAIEKDTTNNPIRYSKLVPMFFRVYDPTKPPSVDGDPNFNDGIPHGRFLLNNKDEIPEDFAEQLKSFTSGNDQVKKNDKIGQQVELEGLDTNRKRIINSQVVKPKVVYDTKLPDSPF